MVLKIDVYFTYLLLHFNDDVFTLVLLCLLRRGESCLGEEGDELRIEK